MKEAKPLFRIFPDKGFIELDTFCGNIMNVFIVYFIVLREVDGIKVNV
jgi:hypothetical protein